MCDAAGKPVCERFVGRNNSVEVLRSDDLCVDINSMKKLALAICGSRTYEFSGIVVAAAHSDLLHAVREKYVSLLKSVFDVLDERSSIYEVEVNLEKRLCMIWEPQECVFEGEKYEVLGDRRSSKWLNMDEGASMILSRAKDGELFTVKYAQFDERRLESHHMEVLESLKELWQDRFVAAIQAGTGFPELRRKKFRWAATVGSYVFSLGLMGRYYQVTHIVMPTLPRSCWEGVVGEEGSLYSFLNDLRHMGHFYSIECVSASHQYREESSRRGLLWGETRDKCDHTETTLVLQFVTR